MNSYNDKKTEGLSGRHQTIKKGPLRALLDEK